MIEIPDGLVVALVAGAALAYAANVGGLRESLDSLAGTTAGTLGQRIAPAHLPVCGGGDLPCWDPVSGKVVGGIQS
jgi:hypothetical protein